MLLRSDYAMVAALWLLSLVPILAGGVRIAELMSDAAITADNERFFQAPTPVVLHIISASIYAILGALQFSRSIRQRHRRVHKINGVCVVLMGTLSALSGLWMTQFYPNIGFDGLALYVLRMLVGSLMLVCLCFGVHAIIRGFFFSHRAWMMRAYALGLGAGTQVFTHIPWFLFPETQSETTRLLYMAMGWLINLAFVEWLLVRKQGSKTAAC